MIVMIVERASPSLRGELCRWFLDPKAGVFVGTVSAMVRDKLWQKVCSEAGEAACLMVHSMNVEQGFVVRAFGDRQRNPVDFEGVTLITRSQQ